ncbi:MAG TPA: histidinol-phosphate transaminase [Dokdonella sp.]|uniref:histidinol-phosphate transaminase n=1 Tax=Dokdonella sp. TaxID=2291710 RepID=UPI0025C2403E|nr:histidinol-phosphate transaminase [Dokdonella sp.]MBX3693176.1 histidinol-phosphate transaminase [Dokdonella sp.]HNR92557.1 histidinol-phosphate transaminase [Dokdonella sp.]
MSFDALALANAATAALHAYDPGHDLPALRRAHGALLAELGSNENVFGPSPRAVAAMREAIGEAYRYPDPKGGALKQALAAQLGIAIDRIALGNGSHELLMLLAQCFAGPGTSTVYSQFGFAVFPIATAAAGAEGIRVPAYPREHVRRYGHDLDAIAAAVRPDTRLVFLANPNNPTASWFAQGELASLLERVPATALVVVDEAYQEFVDDDGPRSALDLVARHPNLVVTRTFSKAHALAGLRVGYLVADAGVVAVIERLRESFNVNAIALAAAEAALSDQEHLEKARAWTFAERTWLSGELAARGYEVLPSQTNFLLVDLGRDATGLEQHLFARGVIVRPMGGYGLGHTLRISIGRRDENERLLAALP